MADDSKSPEAPDSHEIDAQTWSVLERLRDEFASLTHHLPPELEPAVGFEIRRERQR